MKSNSNVTSSHAGSALQAGETGLTEDEAKRHPSHYGLNILAVRAARFKLAVTFLRLNADPMTLVLMVAGAVYFAMGDRFDGTAVLGAVIPIAAVNLELEIRAERALEPLCRIASPTALV